VFTNVFSRTVSPLPLARAWHAAIEIGRIKQTIVLDNRPRDSVQLAVADVVALAGRVRGGRALEDQQIKAAYPSTGQTAGRTNWRTAA
jgi:hypothetical protein